MRRSRRWVVALMILGFACAQFVSLARACTLDLEVAHAATGPAAEPVAGMPADCPFMTEGGAPHVACQAQCMPRAQADQGAEVRIALAPPSVMVVRAVSPPMRGHMWATPPLARIASPPPLLLFGRFLI